jgi:hypothetical protein
MIVLGLLLILAAAGAALFAVMAPSAASQTIEMSALGLTLSASPLAMFIAGAVSVVLLGLGFGLISRGTRRKASSRKELRELRKAQATTDTDAPAQAGQHSSRRDRPSVRSTESDTGSVSHTGTDTDAGSSTEAGGSSGTSKAAGTETSG